ncbi:class I SAM-dependent methyltransferase [Candidatus Woesearchaeota archaeon]|nr:class I SAM-dependent methyltransferase [Candidatus Woesearchaeota archaeon]
MNQQKVWDKIAQSWNNFRNKPIGELKDLNWKRGKILDLGCGNCRNLLPFKNLKCYGLDFSKEMLKEAKKFSKKHNFKVILKHAEITNTKFKNNTFNYILAIATLHHLKNPEKAIKEINRVLKPNGEAFITVWNKLQLKFILKKQETYIPWKKKDEILQRYYNFIGYFELKKIIKKNNFKIMSSNFLGKNIIFRIKKVN